MSKNNFTPHACESQSRAHLHDAKPWDDVFNYVARKALADLHMYPSAPMEDRPDLANLNKAIREDLHYIVDKLPLTDLWALYHLGRILLITVRPDAIFGYVVSQTQASVARYVRGGDEN